MARKFIATVLAAALAVTAIGSGSAQALDRDAKRVIVGAAALAIIGSALAAEQRRNSGYQGSQSHYQPRPPQQNWNGHHNRRDDHRWNGGRHNDGRYNGGRHNGGQASYKVAPQQCLMNVRAHNGWTRGYAVRCTQQNTRVSLPSNCVRRNYAQGPDLFYEAQCLRQYGFRA